MIDFIKKNRMNIGIFRGILRMKKLNEVIIMGKKVFEYKIINYWYELLTEKPHGDLLSFYQKRLSYFWSRSDLEKTIGREKHGDPYAAMSDVDAVFVDKGICPLAPQQGRKAFEHLLDQCVNDKPIVVYIHIPFCNIRCTYCGFFKQKYSEDMEAEYVAKLLKELEQMRDRKYLKNASIEAVFLGGGTPGALTKEQLVRILQKVREILPISSDCEITVESSIYDMDEEKLQACKESGANRFSFGVQTFDTKLRRQLGRPDHCEEVMRKLKLFSAMGVKVIIDLIYGLPGQTKEILQRDLQLYMECGISGIDLYKLQIFPGTPLEKQFKRRQKEFPTGRDLADLFVSGAEFLSSHGCRRLSCCHWANDIQESSRYNMMVKNGAQVLAFGAGCGGSLGDYLYMQPFDFRKYFAFVDQGTKPFTMLLKKDKYAPVFAAIKGQFDCGIFEPQKLDALGNGIPFTKLLEPLLERWERSGLLTKKALVYELSPVGLFWQNQLSRAVLLAVQYIIYGPYIAGRKSPVTAMSAMENRT